MKIIFLCLLFCFSREKHQTEKIRTILLSNEILKKNFEHGYFIYFITREKYTQNLQHVFGAVCKTMEEI